MPSNIPDSLLKLPTLNGKAPESRVESAKDLRELLNQIVQDPGEQQRSRQRALVNANLDRAPPYGRAKLQPWQSNINFGGGRARLDASCQPYHALFSGVEQYAVCRTGYRKQDPDHQRWNDLISQHFHGMIKRWGAFEWHMQHRIKEMLTDGWGPMIRDREGDWRYRAVKANAVHVPRGTPSAVDERSNIILVSVPYKTHELYESIKDEEAASAIGWNINTVKWWIRNAAKSAELKQQSWEKWEEMFRHHSYHTGEVLTDTVHCTHGYVKEYCRKGEKRDISHFIISDTVPTDTVAGVGSSSEKDFLFKHVRRYESFDDCLVVSFGDIGDGQWASVRGQAMNYFKHDVLVNRLMSRAADMLFVEGGLLLSTPNARDRDALELSVMGGGVTFLPAGAQVQQSRLGGAIQGVFDGVKFFQQDLAQNTGYAGQHAVAPEYAGGEKPTAFQVAQQAQKDNALSGDKIALDFLFLDKLMWGMFRAAADPHTQDTEAERFQEDCKRDGVPKEALAQMESVMANRTAGFGSAQMRTMVGKELLAIAGMYPEEGKNNLLNDFTVAASQNPSLALRYNPPQERLTQDDALIVLENAAIKSGAMPLIVSGQSHVKHIQGHLTDTAETLAPVQEAIEAGNRDPEMLMKAVDYLSRMGPHLEQHIAGIQNDPSRSQLVKQFRLELKIMTNMDGQLRQEIRAAQAEAQKAALEQQNANALGLMDEAKLASMEADTQRKDMKAGADLRLKQFKTVESQKLKAWSTQQDAALKTAETLHELGLKKARNGDSEQ